VSRYPRGGALRRIPVCGGDTLTIWRWQGKASWIKALTLRDTTRLVQRAFPNIDFAVQSLA